MGNRSFLNEKPSVDIFVRSISDTMDPAIPRQRWAWVTLHIIAVIQLAPDASIHTEQLSDSVTSRRRTICTIMNESVAVVAAPVSGLS